MTIEVPVWAVWVVQLIVAMGGGLVALALRAICRGRL